MEGNKMKNGISKLDNLYCGLRIWAQVTVKAQKDNGGTWTLGDSYHDQKETRNVDKFLLKKVLYEEKMAEFDLEQKLLTPDAYLDQISALKLMREYLERRIKMLKELYTK